MPPSLVAKTQAELAATLRERGAPGDEERAAELTARALTTAEELGTTTLLERLRATPSAPR